MKLKKHNKDQWTTRYYVESDNSGREYTVAINRDGTWGCSCPAWKFKSPRKDCKHIQFIKTLTSAT